MQESVDVVVTVRLHRLSNLDMAFGTFHADFVVSLDWRYPDFPGEDKVDWSSAFMPQIVIDNAVDLLEPDASSKPKAYFADVWRARISMRFRGNIFTDQLDVHAYPFDSHCLQICLKALKNGRTQVRLRDPDGQISLKDGTLIHSHAIKKRAANFGEFDLEDCPEGQEIEPNRYSVSIYIFRRCQYALWWAFLPMMLLMLVSFTVFCVALEDVGTRLQITLTILLAIIALRSDSGNQPHVAYLTVSDKYAIYGICASSTNCVEHVLIGKCAAGSETAWIALNILLFISVHAWVYLNFKRSVHKQRQTCQRQLSESSPSRRSASKDVVFGHANGAHTMRRVSTFARQKTSEALAEVPQISESGVSGHANGALLRRR